MSCRQGSSRRRAKAKGQSLPKDEDRYNFTDPESRIAVYGDKAFIQGYHYQAAVDDTPRYRARRRGQQPSRRQSSSGADAAGGDAQHRRQAV
ncbi:MAG TPA: hypothetical protein VNF75_04775 [Candidatus Dormibacteraeota bacterium]|nr:hypothetical protein [Candidatus Dormibacteraeota bacterium]